MRTDEVVPLGTILPNFTGGVYTTLDYKNLSFYALWTSRWRFPPQLLQPVGQVLRYPRETVFDEDGNDMRAADYAGVVVEGVNATTRRPTRSPSTRRALLLNQGYVIHALTSTTPAS